MKTYKIRWNEGTYDDASKVSYRQANNLTEAQWEAQEIIRTVSANKYPPRAAVLDIHEIVERPNSPSTNPARGS